MRTCQNLEDECELPIGEFENARSGQVSFFSLGSACVMRSACNPECLESFKRVGHV